MWFEELLDRTGEADVSEDWQKRQQESVKRYEHESYGEDPHDGHLFGNFIATGLPDRNAVVIDIGCGLSTGLPHYVAQLGLTRYLGVEPLTVPVERSYPCLVGVVAEGLPLKDSSVDAAIFATSLDHIEAEDAAIGEVKRVLKPGGKIFIWQGLHEPIMIARQKSFERSLGGGLITGILLVMAEALLTAKRMWTRKRKLARGIRLDNVHFRYYTRSMLLESLDRWGLDPVRELCPRGIPSMFIEARPQHRPNP